MREILFRGKTLTGKWVEGAYYKQELFYGDKEDAHVIITSNEILTYDQALEFSVCIPKTIGQYTGLTDKDGKKIFEGDIVQIEDFTHGCALNYKQPTSNWVVHWREDIARFCIDYMSYLPFDFTEAKIIGNIHDNPELLKGGAE